MRTQSMIPLCISFPNQGVNSHESVNMRLYQRFTRENELAGGAEYINNYN